MDIIDRIEKIIPEEATTTGDVATNTSGTKVGGVATIGYECPEGYEWDEEKRECVLVKQTEESTISGAVVGSGQTRVVGQRDKYLTVVRRNPRPLKFSKLTGAYLPPDEDEEEPEEDFEGEE